MKKSYEAANRNGKAAAGFLGDTTDAIPGVGHVKGTVHLLAGDTKGMKKSYEAANRNGKAAAEFLGDTAEAIPVVGHAKGTYHYIAGDRTKGDECMKKSSRSVAVTGGAFSGFCMGGPLGAITGGVTGGAICDGLITGIESGIHKEYRPAGLIENGTQIHDGIK